MGRLQRKKPDSKKKKAKLAAKEMELNGAPKKPAPAPAPKQAQASEGPKGPAFWTNSVQFLREVRGELKKVTWPSRKQTVGSTAVVIILVAVISMFLGLVDMGLTEIVRLVIG
ncbi:preprotein translocase subunit SecE [Desulfatibacillum alkenivorans DSM 16219]|jgi:preprotein translocase subunit SecE|uniref:Protein translocase subunit SecE n=1 Tax=Desulfatibacillum alkenivorans DSM 16219 TaxID=1121393 RepID=A0A1M7AJF7_9BACT|nr:preprotein translocase subunit SecE [Desulfatibacillum alkenivorans]SHL42858.1 preprotein translocase subunit SecE [Desulfatibacillum alkenivorans DSM 16219]